MKNPFLRNKKNDYNSYDDNFDDGFYRGEEDEEDGVIDDLAEEQASKTTQRRSTQSAATGSLLKVVKPHNYDDGPAIAGYLMDGYTVVMNIEELDRPAAMRLIDFLLGAITVLDGEFRRVTNTTLVFAPRTGEVTGEDSSDEI